MKNYLKKISTNYGLEYFTDEKNIPNQELVKETIEYFQTGEGSRVFKPLEFLNLLEKQYQYIQQNYKDSEGVIVYLKALPLNNLEKHILFGLLIKWFGGYPFNEGTDFDENWRVTKKGIEKEFLKYKGETPEKNFCKADNESRKYMMKLGKVFTTSINTGIDVNEILYPMQGARSYYTFDELFEDAARNGAVGESSNQQDYLLKKCRYDIEFSVWLKENKGLEYGNETQYKQFLKKEIFLEFLKYELEQEIQQKSEIQKQMESWKIVSPQKTENDIQYSLLDLFDEQVENISNFKSLKRYITKNGFMVFNNKTKSVNVYTTELAFILSSKELPVKEMFNSKELIINGFDYLETYIEAYKEGESYFDQEFAIPIDTLYGKNAELYVKAIHENYYHIKQPEIDDGWGWAKRTFPSTLSHKILHKFGYYAGIVSKVDAMRKKHPNIFAAYDKCDNSQNIKIDAKTNQEIPKTFEDLFHFPGDADQCLNILRELQQPVIDSQNNFIGNAKGVFPLWIKVLKNHKPKPLIKHFKDIVYKDILNGKIKGLNLTKDASEFRKQYKRLLNNNTELDIKAILSQLSQSGKLGI